jgi:hypothetical protein
LNRLSGLPGENEKIKAGFIDFSKSIYIFANFVKSNLEHKKCIGHLN